MIKEYFYHYQWHCSDVTLRLGASREITYHNQHPEEDWQVTLLDTGLATHDRRPRAARAGPYPRRRISAHLRRRPLQRATAGADRVPPRSRAASPR